MRRMFSSERCRPFISKYMPFKDYDEYYAHVKTDIEELTEEYPFSRICIIPTVEPVPIELDVIVANQEIINEMNATVEDFIGDHSKEIKVVIPYNYPFKGCDVYGGSWLEDERIEPKDQHYYKNCLKNGMPMLCVGVPESFISLHNVILENVRTADMMLNAYDLYLSGKTKKLELKAYAHGEAGKKQYKHDGRRYKTS